MKLPQWMLNVGSWIKDFYSKYTVEIIIVVSLAAGTLLIIHGTVFLKDLGKSVITTGIGAAIFKVFQFSGVFRKEANESFIKILGTKEFIEKLKYEEVYELWANASDTLYYKKFPKISKRLQEIISSAYFPKNAKYYYERFHCEIKINDYQNGYLDTEETIMVEIKAENKEPIDLVSGTTIDIYEPEKSNIEVDYLIVHKKGDEDVVAFEYVPDDADFSCEGGKKRFYKSFKVEGQFNYEMFRRMKKIYPLTGNETKSFTFSSITQFASYSILMDKKLTNQLNIRYERLGTLELFKVNKTQLRKNPNCVDYKQYKDLILPKQGFVFHITEK
ncbi:MAG: hypothetical protein MI975_27555 [Cytophagales bacterium]|nr:hypothetical protein [Cytophagales bacterium]